MPKSGGDKIDSVEKVRNKMVALKRRASTKDMINAHDFMPSEDRVFNCDIAELCYKLKL